MISRPPTGGGFSLRPGLRGLGVIAIFLSALLVTAALIGDLLPARDLPSVVREKYAYLAAHGNEYEALFLGSSRVYNQVMPTVFDSELAGRGLTVHSFNAGVWGMYPPEDSYVLDQILSLKPRRLRWVFVEAQPLQTTLEANNQNTLEEEYWHDWPRFVLLCKRLVTTRPLRHRKDRMQEMIDRCPDFREHVGMFVHHVTNSGRGSVLLGRWIGLEPAPAANWGLLGQFRDGWGRAPANDHRKRDVIAALDRDLEKSRRNPPVKSYADPISQEALGAMIAKIEKAGATPVLLIPPIARGTYFSPDPERARNLIILDFCQPQLYPELYQLENRSDLSHLNPAGALIFSHLIAEKFIAALGHR